ncbi:MAG: phosphoadenylyl-sulfate reductase [Pseudomonadota bacterium]|nr:phosphoadenylyl-sulfate reductase [Pseudomonadota bacterium]
MLDQHVIVPEEAETSRLVARVAEAYGGLDGRALLEPLILRVFRGRVALVSSFGAESAVLLHMVAGIDRRTPVIFLNTGKLFGETLAYRELLVERLGLADVRDERPDRSDAGRDDLNGDLWSRDPRACCWIRKVLPLQRSLNGFSAWITGRKRMHGGLRAGMPLFEMDGDQVKINPLAGWDGARIAEYMKAHDLPAHPLVKKGFTSIGCAPCTTPVAAGEDHRAGRWRGSDKSECGIHFMDGRPVRAGTGTVGTE